MRSLRIRNPETNPEVTRLVNETFDAIPDHWKKILPEIEIVVSTTPFNRIPELKEFIDFQNEVPGWRQQMWEIVQAMCPTMDSGEVTIWVRFFHQNYMYPNDYYFMKELYEVVAKIIWFCSPELRDAATNRMPNTLGFGGPYGVFRDTFSRFFLNPEWLKEKRGEAWEFIQDLDLQMESRSELHK